MKTSQNSPTTRVVVSAQLGRSKVAVAHLTNGTFPQRQAKQHLHTDL
jgi:hypothetical protein